MLGKSVLPRVLVRVTLLLPAHLPVLIGLRVTHSWGCVYVYVFVYVYVRARDNTTPSYLPSYTRLGHAIPGSKTVSVGVCVCMLVRATNTLTSITTPA